MKRKAIDKEIDARPSRRTHDRSQLAGHGGRRYGRPPRARKAVLGAQHHVARWRGSTSEHPALAGVGRSRPRRDGDRRGASLVCSVGDARCRSGRALRRGRRRRARATRSRSARSLRGLRRARGRCHARASLRPRRSRSDRRRTSIAFPAISRTRTRARRVRFSRRCRTPRPASSNCASSGARGSATCWRWATPSMRSRPRSSHSSSVTRWIEPVKARDRSCAHSTPCARPSPTRQPARPTRAIPCVPMRYCSSARRSTRIPRRRGW